MAKTPKSSGPLEGGPLRVLGYVRVSTEDQADSGAGLTAQRQSITDATSIRGFQLVEILEDAGFSGKSMDRPGIATAIERIENREADALMVAKLDRLSRSLLDFALLMEQARKKGWSIIALDLGVDTSTPSGELLASVLATFSQFERRLIGQRTREALAVKKAQGVRLGRPRSAHQAVVDRIVRERKEGRTLRAICESLTRDGIPTVRGGATWDPSVVRRMLLAEVRDS